MTSTNPSLEHTRDPAGARTASPYESMSLEAVIDDFVLVRGDLTEGYARAQLARVITERIARAEHTAWAAGFTHARFAHDGELVGTPDDNPHPAP